MRSESEVTMSTLGIPNNAAFRNKSLTHNELHVDAFTDCIQHSSSCTIQQLDIKRMSALLLANYQRFIAAREQFPGVTLGLL